MKKLRLFLLIFVAVFACVMGFVPQNVAYAENRESVYIGGFPVGISLDIGGLLVDSVTGVETEYGTAYVEGLRRGDIIKSIDGKDVASADDIQSNLTFAPTKLVIVRGGSSMELTVTPLMEAYSNKPKLGVKIKDKIFGIGTVTFVRSDGSYAALGHEIYDSETSTHIPFVSGKIHSCKILGIKKGEKGEAGALLGSLSPDNEVGSVSCNNKFGIAGTYAEKRPESDLIEVAQRSEVKPGPAKIRTATDGVPEYYDIEIIKASKRHGRNEKGIVFRVTDPKLLDKTGGVVRGMSGSPIVQNGRLVGAVTHVFLNDFTKGYGIYADCLN